MLGVLTFEIYSTEKERLINRQTKQIEYLQESQITSFGQLIGNSQQMNSVYKAIGLVLENDITILLQGETGTGKNLIASIVHQNSNRRSKPMVTINCGAIPTELIESELFGHEKGAFTGADEKKIGKFELAHQGTLFLDEIGDLPLSMQVKLLHAIQQKEVVRVGGSKTIPVDVRIIAATHQNLTQMVSKKLFREDLFYRLNIYPIQIAPLRKRVDDIVPLATHFAEKYSTQFDIPFSGFSDDAIDYLKTHPFPGNIRELENLIQRSIILAQNHIITSTVLTSQPGQEELFKLTDGHESDSSNRSQPTFPIQTLESVEKRAIIDALNHTNQNIRQTAKALGVSRTTLYNKMDKYQIQSKSV